jgi:hypothetical protein
VGAVHRHAFGLADDAGAVGMKPWLTPDPSTFARPIVFSLLFDQ